MNAETPSSISSLTLSFEEWESWWLGISSRLPPPSALAIFGILGYITYQRVSRYIPGHGIPVVKSAFPWVGSAIDFVRAPANFLQDCRARYGLIYKIHAAGRTILITSSPKAIFNMLNSKNKDFEFPDFLNIHHIMGFDESRMSIIWPATLKVFDISHKFLTPHRVGPLVQSYNTMVFQHFTRLTADDSATLCLEEFVFRTNHFAVYGMLMGEHFTREARTYNNWKAFDSGVHDIIRRLPFFSRAPTKGREGLLETVSDHIRQYWIGSGKEGHLDGASELMSALTRSVKESAATEEETSRIINYALWGASSGIARLTNWVMRYILVHPDLHQAIQLEVQQVVDTKYAHFNEMLGIEARSLGTDFPLLTSTVDEVIRLVSQSVILRQATVDTHIVADNGVDIPLSKGDYIMADTQGYHLSDEHFEDAQTFKPNRYLQETNNRAKHTPKPSLAFSTGPRVCSGAYLAKANVRMFVILCLRLYDVEIRCDSGVESALEVVHNSLLQLPLPKFKADVILRRRDT